MKKEDYHWAVQGAFDFGDFTVLLVSQDVEFEEEVRSFHHWGRRGSQGKTDDL
jgi:hypothetical protein